MTRTLSLKEQRYPITSTIIKRSVIYNYISVINYYTFIVPKRTCKQKKKIININSKERTQKEMTQKEKVNLHSADLLIKCLFIN